jgi:hypothetical protein
MDQNENLILSLDAQYSYAQKLPHVTELICPITGTALMETCLSYRTDNISQCADGINGLNGVENLFKREGTVNSFQK